MYCNRMIALGFVVPSVIIRGAEPMSESFAKTGYKVDIIWTFFLSGTGGYFLSLKLYGFWRVDHQIHFGRK